jgi:putative ABC transport system ATP-binding protein
MLISLREIRKVYRMGEVDIEALRGVSLEVDEGEFLAIMGASGSGKTTLMNIMGCLDRPTAGEYLLAGKDITKLSDDELARVRNKKIGFVFQSFNLLARTSALENVEMPLIYGDRMSSSEKHKRAKELLEKVGLGKRIHHHPSQLSGGEQQRVAIARALVNRPSLILADEPTGNLDTKASAEIMALFKELNAEGITIVMVTHEPDIAEYAKRKIFMRDGRIISS